MKSNLSIIIIYYTLPSFPWFRACYYYFYLGTTVSQLRWPDRRHLLTRALDQIPHLMEFEVYLCGDLNIPYNISLKTSTGTGH